MREAIAFRTAHGLIGSDEGRFISLHVRRGQKSIEVAPTPLEVYTNATLAAARCLGVRNVHVMTEDQGVIDALEPWAVSVGLALAYTENPRPGVDSWNPTLLKKLNLSAAAAAAAMSMDQVANVSALNLKVSSHADAAVGLFHSSWARLMAAVMWAAHPEHPPRLLNVRSAGMGTDDILGTHSAGHQADWDVANCLPWECPAAPGLECRHRLRFAWAV